MYLSDNRASVEVMLLDFLIGSHYIVLNYEWLEDKIKKNK